MLIEIKNGVANIQKYLFNCEDNLKKCKESIQNDIDTKMTRILEFILMKPVNIENLMKDKQTGKNRSTIEKLKGDNDSFEWKNFISKLNAESESCKSTVVNTMEIE